MKKLNVFAVSLFVILCSYTSAFSDSVNAFINCNTDSTVDASADAFSSYNSAIQMDLWFQGPGTSSYSTSTSSTGYAHLQGSLPFQYDSFFTVTACAYFQNFDSGDNYICDTQTCVTQIPPAFR